MSLSRSTLPLLRTPQLAQLRWLSLAAPCKEETSAVVSAVAFQLPLLHTLCLSSFARRWPQEALRCFLDEECLPQLTSLRCEGDIWQHYLADAPLANRLKRLTLVHGYTYDSNRIALCSSNLCGLRVLRLQRWRHQIAAPRLQSIEDCFAAGLLDLQSLTLDNVNGIDFVLGALHHLPSLRWLRILVPFEEHSDPALSLFDSSVPSLPTMQTMMESCPKIEQLNLSITISGPRPPSPHLSSCVGDPRPAVERKPSEWLCELRDGCEQLPRMQVEFLVASAD
jgi:hypothetical protein